MVNKTYLQIFNTRGWVVGTGRNQRRRYVKVAGQGGKRIKTEESLAPDDAKDKDEDNVDKKDWIIQNVAILPDMIVQGAVQKIK